MQRFCLLISALGGLALGGCGSATSDKPDGPAITPDTRVRTDLRRDGPAGRDAAPKQDAPTHDAAPKADAVAKDAAPKADATPKQDATPQQDATPKQDAKQDAAAKDAAPKPDANALTDGAIDGPRDAQAVDAPRDGARDQGCIEGAKQPCYTGTPNTLGVGPCVAGQRTCSGGVWGGCVGQVVPQAETCDGKDNDCNGKIDDGLTRACSTACGSGTETCVAGAWIGCTAPKPSTETCDGKDNDCNGKVDDGLTRPCANLCGSGIETCVAGSWVNCTAPKPSTETCDGKDNDCNGKVDDGLTRPCANLCGSGIETCVAGSWVNCTAPKPMTEVCDGKDNNCNGQIDESDPNLGQSCTVTANKGECRAGTYACVTGKLTCQSSVLPITEVCRDGKDNDCDGQTDEICGDLLSYAVVNGAGTFAFQRDFAKVAKTATGTYQLSAANAATHGCFARPLFVSARSSSMRPVAYSCNNTDFVVRVAGHAPRTSPPTLYDWAFSAVAPYATSGTAYGVVEWVTPTAFLTTRSYGSPTVTRAGVGIYDIAFAGCNTVAQPVFTTVSGTTPDGYATGYYQSSGVCRVRTFDLNGAAADRSFAFWIPNRTRVAYAIIGATGSIVASNYFGDQTARWTATQVNDASGNPNRYDVSYPGWTTNSGLLATPRTGSATHAGVVPVTGGARVYVRDVSTASLTTAVFSVLFAQ